MGLLPKGLPKTVVALGLASFFTDMSSEMIYPLLPVFLSTVLGAGAMAIGVIEGIAETTAAVLKIASGWWADRVSRRKPLILAGYGVAGLVRPLIGLAGSWGFVLAMRFTDRVGKGIRTSPRDALIADVTDADKRGMAYGFHRSMDHAGAVAGPLIATLLLSAWVGFSLRTVFLCAFAPAIVVMFVLAFGVKETPRQLGAAEGDPAKPKARMRDLGPNFRGFMIALVVFTLGNSTDAFILLRLTQAGVAASMIALLWALHHVVKMVSTYYGGKLSDRLGRRPLILSGWAVYAAIYLGFAMGGSAPVLIALFLLYGVYYGLTEPCEKAWVADIAPKHLRGSAMGWYNGMVGLGALPASLLFGVVYTGFGPAAAFGMGAAFAGLAALLLSRVASPQPA
jgi:MFS family permease